MSCLGCFCAWVLRSVSHTRFLRYTTMKGTKVQTLSALYACAPLIDGLGHTTRSTTYMYLSANRLATCSCVIMSECRAAPDLDTYPLNNLICLRCVERDKPGRGKPVLIMHIGFFVCFHANLSNAVVSAKSAHYFSCPYSAEAVGITHKLPRSL